MKTCKKCISLVLCVFMLMSCFSGIQAFASSESSDLILDVEIEKNVGNYTLLTPTNELFEEYDENYGDSLDSYTIKVLGDEDGNLLHFQHFPFDEDSTVVMSFEGCQCRFTELHDSLRVSCYEDADDYDTYELSPCFEKSALFSTYQGSEALGYPIYLGMIADFIVVFIPAPVPLDFYDHDANVLPVTISHRYSNIDKSNAAISAIVKKVWDEESVPAGIVFSEDNSSYTPKVYENNPLNGSYYGYIELEPENGHLDGLQIQFYVRPLDENLSKKYWEYLAQPCNYASIEGPEDVSSSGKSPMFSPKTLSSTANDTIEYKNTVIGDTYGLYDLNGQFLCGLGCVNNNLVLCLDEEDDVASEVFSDLDGAADSLTEYFHSIHLYPILDNHVIEANVGDHFRMTPKTVPENANYSTFSTSTSNPEKLAYDSGSITVLQEGTESFSVSVTDNKDNTIEKHYTFKSPKAQQGVVASGQCGPDAFWSLSSDHVFTVTPGTDDTKTKNIWQRNFWKGDSFDAYDVTSIVIEDGITSIGRAAFGDYSEAGFTLEDTNSYGGMYEESNGAIVIKNFKNAASVSLPNTLESVDMYAFRHCTGLTGALRLPDSVREVKASAFSHCSGLTSLVLNNGIETIGSNAFEYCTKLDGDLIVPDSVMSIGNNAFSGCSGITGAIVIGNGVKTIGNSAFRFCSSATSLQFGSAIETIGDYAFDHCSHLTGTLVLPESLKTLGKAPFCHCAVYHNGSTTQYVKLEESTTYQFFKNYCEDTDPYKFVWIVKGTTTKPTKERVGVQEYKIYCKSPMHNNGINNASLLASIYETIPYVPVESLTVTPTSISVKADTTTELDVSITPSNASYPSTYIQHDGYAYFNLYMDNGKYYLTAYAPTPEPVEVTLTSVDDPELKATILVSVYDYVQEFMPESVVTEGKFVLNHDILENGLFFADNNGNPIMFEQNPLDAKCGYFLRMNGCDNFYETVESAEGNGLNGHVLTGPALRYELDADDDFFVGFENGMLVLTTEKLLEDFDNVPTSIHALYEEFELSCIDSLRLNANIFPTYASYDKNSVSWQTADANVAVFENGVLRGVHQGTTTLTVSFVNGDRTTVTQTYPVIVTAPVAVSAVEASAEKDGSKEYYVSSNGDVYVLEGNSYVLSSKEAVLSHYLLDPETSVIKPATCTEDGQKQIVTKCANCDYETSELVTIPKNGHRYGDVVESTIPATCTTEGRYVQEKTCVDCGDTVVVKSASLPKLDHSDANNDGVCDSCGRSIGTISEQDDHNSNAGMSFWQILINFIRKIASLIKGLFER